MNGGRATGTQALDVSDVALHGFTADVRKRLPDDFFQGFRADVDAGVDDQSCILTRFGNTAAQ